MIRLGLLLKSYAGDHAYAVRLIASFRAHNPTGLTLYCVVPESDVPLFTPLAGGDVQVLSEEPFARHFTNEPIHGIRPGYINQEIVKLAFWELGLVDSYFCIDSDALIIRDISESDFLSPDDWPYTVLVEDKDLHTEPAYYKQYWQSREQAMRLIADTIGFEDPILRTCHGHQVMSATVLESFVSGFLSPRGWDYLDALKVAPYEFSWYNFWLQHTRVIPLHQREPFVKVFHNERQYLEFLVSGAKIDDLARAYVAVVINSNFSRDRGLAPLGESKSVALAPMLSYVEYAHIGLAKIRSSLDAYRRNKS
jgi:hypothetical protein